ncbi:general substrate transporter [Aspergillus steynii IBT 23096]|uniref:General substrate transporter n=1 Tax=Aspergillus steynii IBT 23096 TaxID=1392250 RepID=A0A2I2GGM5_9EURO|nr:general substrate transporter [Aspergillus steynii IBT 23096]PLB52020.1 general substrate transporter [Aspergillus steynii IBT 23096]
MVIQNNRIVSSFNPRLLFSCSLIALSQVNFGMDQGAFSNTQAMGVFTQKFGEYNPDTDAYALNPTYLSLLNSLPYIGFAVGLACGGFVSRRFGRRMSMFVMCLWALVGATILVTAQSKAQMLAGRIVAYVYIGMELAVVPVFQSEIVPAQVRGFVVGTYQAGLLVGQLLMSIICRGTSDLKGDASWKIPLGLLYIIPSIVACSVWFMPESPRLLMLNSQPEKAQQALQSLRRGRFSAEQIEHEFQQLQNALAATKTPENDWQIKEIFQGWNLQRTMITIGTNVFMQLTGQNFVSHYGPIFIQSLGAVNPFSMSCINSGINIVVVLVTMGLVDRVGRVPLMLLGSLTQLTSRLIMGSLGTLSTPSGTIKAVITATVTVFGAGYSLGWAPLSHVVAAETPTSRLRDVTYTTGTLFNVVIQFGVSFAVPYLLYEPARLGSKVGFIFAGCALGAVLFTWFCVPEGRGRTLEEMDELWERGVRVRDFRRRDL